MKRLFFFIFWAFNKSWEAHDEIHYDDVLMIEIVDESGEKAEAEAQKIMKFAKKKKIVLKKVMEVTPESFNSYKEAIKQS